MNKKTGWIILGILVIVIAAVMLGNIRNKTYKNTIVIDVGQTGSYSPYGEMVVKAAQLAQKDLAMSGQKINLIISDNKSDAKSALSAYQAVKGVQFVISGSSGVVLALAPVLEKDKVLLFNVTALSPAIREAGDYVFSNINDSTVEVAAMAAYMYKSGVKKAATFIQNDDAGVTANKIFKDEFTKLGGIVVDEESFDVGAMDMKTQISRLKNAKPDAVYAPAYPQSLSIILRQAENLTFLTKWFSWNIESKEILDLGKIAERITYSSTVFNPSKGNQVVKDFSDRFTANFGVVPPVYAATSYDAVMLAAEAFKQGLQSGTDIKNFLYGVKNWQGVSGVTNFDSDGMSIKPIEIKTIKDGQYVTIQ